VLVFECLLKFFRKHSSYLKMKCHQKGKKAQNTHDLLRCFGRIHSPRKKRKARRKAKGDEIYN